MIDTHCHLTFPQLHRQLDDVLARAAARGVDEMICVGTNGGDAVAAAALAERYAHIHATAGLHPLYVTPETDLDAAGELLRWAAARREVVAFGEMGLDYHYDEPARELQHAAFARQLEVIAAMDSARPIIIHNRKATDDVLAMIAEAGLAGERFVFHCFTGDRAEVERVLAAGAMVSFTGIVTFPNARDVAEASDAVPIERLMVETDSPFLTPEPNRKVRPNEPAYVVDVARFLADRRGMAFEAFVEAVDANARRFFSLA
ncbi:MAG: TatD family hydrolase [Phycisphaeraceae bacterium]